MANDIKFVDGMFVNAPHQNAPEYVKVALAFKPEEFAEWVQAQEPDAKGYVKIDVLEAKSGKWYAKVNDFKPTRKEDDPPF